MSLECIGFKRSIGESGARYNTVDLLTSLKSSIASRVNACRMKIKTWERHGLFDRTCVMCSGRYKHNRLYKVPIEQKDLKDLSVEHLSVSECQQWCQRPVMWMAFEHGGVRTVKKWKRKEWSLSPHFLSRSICPGPQGSGPSAGRASFLASSYPELPKCRWNCSLFMDLRRVRMVFFRRFSERRFTHARSQPSADRDTQ